MKNPAFVCLLLTVGFVTAQNDFKKVKSTPYFKFSTYPAGFIIPHSKELIDVSKSKPWGGEIQLGWLQDAGEKLERNGVYSKRGFSLSYFNFDNPNVLGSATSLSLFVEPIFMPKYLLRFATPIGFGLTYLNKTHHPEKNPTNLFFSSNLSFLLFAGFQLNYLVSPFWELNAGINYLHISNGGIKKPNKGMNFPMATVGATKYLNPVKFQKIVKPLKDSVTKDKSLRFTSQFSFSVKNTPETPEHASTPELVLGMFTEVKKPISQRANLSLAHEIFWDGYLQENAKRANQRQTALINSICFGNELVFGKMLFSTHIGTYLHHPLRNHDVIYQRYGLFFKHKNIIVGASLRAHRHVAEVIECRLGFQWK